MDESEAISIVVQAARDYQEYNAGLTDEEEEALEEAIEVVNTLDV